MYNVLNLEGDKITVKTINPQIHKHLSGRDFTEDDACVKKIVKEELGTVEDIVKAPVSRVALEILYKEKYGRKPSSQMKTENIISKL